MLIIIFVLFFIRVVPGSADWTLLNGTSSTFWYVGLTYCEGKVYLYESTGGGGDGFWEYDVLSDLWRQRASTPIIGKGAYLEADSSSGLIYWHSGYQQFFVYDPMTDTWIELAQTPVAAWSGGYVMTNSDMCINPVTQKIFWHNGNRAFYEYDIGTDVWIQKDSLPVSGNGDMVIHPGLNKIYWHQGFDPNSGHQDGFYEYDIATDQWRALTFTPVTCANGGLAILPSLDKIYWSRGGLSADFLEYDIAGDTWTSLGSTPRNGQFGNLAADWTGNYIYYYAGFNVTPDSIFWQYAGGVGLEERLTGAEQGVVKDLTIRTSPIINGNKIILQIGVNSSEDVNLKIIDAGGRVLLSRNFMFAYGSHELHLDVSGFVQGVYFIVATTSYEQTVTKVVLLK